MFCLRRSTRFIASSRARKQLKSVGEYGVEAVARSCLLDPDRDWFVGCRRVITLKAPID